MFWLIFSNDSIFLLKGELLGSLESMADNIQKIITSTSMEMMSTEAEENQNTEVREVEKKFITSPADVEIHRRVNLQNAKVTEEDLQKFKKLCEEYDDIFSKDSTDIGRTPLITMEIDTSDSPPISQRPYNLPLKHSDWVQKELGYYAESRSNYKKCFTMGKSNSNCSKENRTRRTTKEEVMCTLQSIK